MKMLKEKLIAALPVILIALQEGRLVIIDELDIYSMTDVVGVLNE